MEDLGGGVSPRPEGDFGGGGEDGSEVALRSGPLSWAAVSSWRLRTDTAGFSGLPEVSPEAAGEEVGREAGRPLAWASQPGLGGGLLSRASVSMSISWPAGGPAQWRVGPRDPGALRPAGSVGWPRELKWCLGLAGAEASWAFGRAGC